MREMAWRPVGEMRANPDLAVSLVAARPAEACGMSHCRGLTKPLGLDHYDFVTWPGFPLYDRGPRQIVVVFPVR